MTKQSGRGEGVGMQRQSEVRFCEYRVYDNSEPTEDTDTWGQLVLLTTILSHKACKHTSRQVLENTLFAINAIFIKGKVKVSHSLIAVGAVGVRVPLYLGHS